MDGLRSRPAHYDMCKMQGVGKSVSLKCGNNCGVQPAI